MRLKLEDNFLPIHSKDITTFEQQIGYTLPDEYRQFLLKTNGGRPHCDLIKTPDGELFYAAFFMGLAPEQTVLYNLPTEIDESFIGPAWFLPIAVCEHGSNLYLCLSLKQDESFGQIYSWDEELAYHYSMEGYSDAEFKTLLTEIHFASRFSPLLEWGSWKWLRDFDEKLYSENLSQLYVAVRNQDLSEIQKHLKTEENINIALHEGTLLDYALRDGNAQICELLLQHGAQSEEDAILQASTPEVAELLRRYGHNIECTQHSLYSQSPPISSHSYHGRLPLVKFFVESGIDLSRTWDDKNVLEISLNSAHNGLHQAERFAAWSWQKVQNIQATIAYLQDLKKKLNL